MLKELLRPWLDEEDIYPGVLFQYEIQKAISQVKSAAICIGLELGKWQKIEVNVLMSQFVDNDMPVIPVLLPGVERIPDDLLFLKQINWVNFQNINDAAALNKLESGIRREKPNPPNEPRSINVKLKSKIDVDYTKLRDLLAARNWREANRETTRVMLKAANRREERYFTSRSIEEFSCEDLQIIDKLWLRFSDNRFGFSVQKRIWEEVGSPRVDAPLQMWREFYINVGWKAETSGTENGEGYRNPQNLEGYNSIEDVPNGYFPATLYTTERNDNKGTGAHPLYSSLFSRMHRENICNL